jgi:hypothetical protein
MTKLPVMPIPRTFLLETPLYKKFKRDSQKILDLRDYAGPLDSYCPGCEESSIFKRSDPIPSRLMAASPPLHAGFVPHLEKQPPFFDMRFECARDKHEAVFYFMTDNNAICKIGEFPSKAETFLGNSIKYKEILGDEFMSFQLARELYSQAVGAGSFVYLRRIFENVIVKRIANRKYSESLNWNYSEWKVNNTMDKKLNDISSYLPNFINNQELFRVLSAAVHELDETACLQYFRTVEMAITEILDAEISIDKKRETRRLINNEIKKIDRGLKN